MRSKPVITASVTSLFALGSIVAAAAPAQAAGKNMSGYVVTGHGKALLTYTNFRSKIIQKNVTLPYTVTLTKRHVTGSKYFSIIVSARDYGQKINAGCKVVKNGHVLQKKRTRAISSTTCRVTTLKN
jgi:hypothetical protein